jgi:glyoxylase-like metal-dependent hydrolase (beta-lactamase superfamily II)
VATCIAAPGHCAGLTVYSIDLDGEHVWFVGDLVLTTLQPGGVQLPWTGAPDFSKQRYIETMTSLIALSCDHVLPGHGPPILGAGRRVLEEALAAAMVEWR